VVHLKGEPAERFFTVHPRTQNQSPVHIAEVALKSLRRGLTKAGIAPESFELQPDTGPFGWRAPYRGLEALEPEDAAVFFGRSADIVGGIGEALTRAVKKDPSALYSVGRFLLWELDDPVSATPYLEAAAIRGNVEAAFDLLTLALFRRSSAGS
jgi:hypothetical protein